jgi:hypothetical protein
MDGGEGQLGSGPGADLGVSGSGEGGAEEHSEAVGTSAARAPISSCRAVRSPGGLQESTPTMASA